MVFLACDLDSVITAVAEIAKEFRAGLIPGYQLERYLISLCSLRSTTYDKQAWATWTWTSKAILAFLKKTGRP